MDFFQPLEGQSVDCDFTTAKHRPFTYFLTKYYSTPGVASLKSLRVVIINVEMDAKLLSNKNLFALSSYCQRKNAIYKIVLPNKIVIQKLHNQEALDNTRVGT